MIVLNHTDQRIIKLYKRGLSLRSISNKIGRPGDIERVKKAIRKVVDNLDELEVMEKK